MKKIIITGILFIILGITILYRNDLLKLYSKHFIRTNKEIKLSSKNPYYKDKNYKYVQNTTNFIPKNRQDILNIYYTIINAGEESFTFYCPDEYIECLSEVQYIATDQTILSHINNFVHPYNSFKNIETEYDSLGKVNVKLQHTYTKKEIELLNEKIKSVENQLYKNIELTLQNKIKEVHDFIINNSKYDSERSDYNIVKYNSDKASGPLFEGYGLCGGYTDAMALFLTNMGIENYKVASENHVWNAVNYNGTWYHLDLTWDDPVTSNNSDLLEYNFFLINTIKLQRLEVTQHLFDTTIYQEVA